MAAECDRHRGLHLFEDLIVAEIKRLEAELATADADTRIGAALDGMPDGFPDTGLPDDGDDSLLDG